MFKISYQDRVGYGDLNARLRQAFVPRGIYTEKKTVTPKRINDLLFRISDLFWGDIFVKKNQLSLYKDIWSYKMNLMI